MSDEDRETKGERTRRRLLEIAIDHFGRKGYRATSVTEITREAGLTQAASYAYFENKGALFRAAVDHDAESLVQSVTAPLADTPIRELLPAVLVFLASGLDEHPLAVRVMSGQEPEMSTQLDDLPALLEVRRVLTARLVQAQAAGEIRADVEAEPLATGLQVVLLALLTTMMVGRAPGVGSAAATPADDVLVGVLTVFDALLRPPQR
jgi:AcrR family transcriptional regulator